MEQTLVLDQGYQPHRVVSWQRAIVLVFGGKVEVVETYDIDVRGPSLSVKMPAVVRLVGRTRRPARRVRFSRMNVARQAVSTTAERNESTIANGSCPK